MRNITTLIQIVLAGGTAYLFCLLWASRSPRNSARVCPSCKVALGKFDAVHCQDCLEFGELFSAEHKASNSGGGN